MDTRCLRTVSFVERKRKSTEKRRDLRTKYGVYGRHIRYSDRK